MLPPSDAPASPSTQEAIQGMLCMANLQSSSSSPGAGLQAWLAAGHERSSAGASGTQRSGKRALKRPAHHSTDSEEEASLDEQESLGACFKDAEYSKERDGKQGGFLGSGGGCVCVDAWERNGFVCLLAEGFERKLQSCIGMCPCHST